jgi:serine/threonine-protein kinase
MLDVCNALAEAHERGIVHRDVKPQNVFLTSNFVVKVLDFGLAKRMPQEAPSPVSSGLTLPDTAVGSPFWMSPEQVRSGPVDARTDVWGVGVTLYFLLTGEAPFTAPQLLLLTARILSDPPVAIESRRRGVPEPVEAIVLRCLSKQPSARFQTIGELAAALRSTRMGGDVAAAADTTPMSCPPTHVETGTMTTRKHPVKKRR